MHVLEKNAVNALQILKNPLNLGETKNEALKDVQNLLTLGLEDAVDANSKLIKAVTSLLGAIRLHLNFGDSMDDAIQELDFALDWITNSNKLYLYILMRNDVRSLVGTEWVRLAGKACAQASHAANQMVFEGKHSKNPEFKTLIEEWSKEANGFGTCIVLGANEQQMREIIQNVKNAGFHANITHDPTYPLNDGETVHLIPLDTCAYIFGHKGELQLFLEGLSLLP